MNFDMETMEGLICEFEQVDSNNNEISLQGLIPGLEDTQEEREWEKERRSRVQKWISWRIAHDPKNVEFFWGEEQRDSELDSIRGNVCLLTSSAQEFAHILKNRIEGNYVGIDQLLPKDFRTILEYLMGEFTWKFSTIRETCSLIEASAKFGLTGLKDEIFQLLTLRSKEGEEFLDDENACRAWCLFKQCDRDNYLASSAKEYILRNGENIFGGDHFLNLPLRELEELLKDDGLTINCELDIFKAVLRWGIHNLKKFSRKCTAETLGAALATLIPHLRFSNMSDMEFKNYVMPWNFLSPQQNEWIQKSWKTLIFLSEQGPVQLAKFNVKPRNYIGKSDENGKTHEDLLLQIQSTEAELFHAKNAIDFDRHNFNRELEDLKSTVAQLQQLFLRSHGVSQESSQNLVDNKNLISPDVETQLRNESDNRKNLENLFQSRIHAQNTELEKLRADLATQSTGLKILRAHIACQSTELEKLNRDLAAQSKLFTELRASHQNQMQLVRCIFYDLSLMMVALKKSVESQQILEKNHWHWNQKEKEAAESTKGAMDILLRREENIIDVLIHNDTPSQLEWFYWDLLKDEFPEHGRPLRTSQANRLSRLRIDCNGNKIDQLLSCVIGELRLMVRLNVDYVENKRSMAIGHFSAGSALKRELLLALIKTEDVTQKLNVSPRILNLRFQATVRPGYNNHSSILFLNFTKN